MVVPLIWIEEVSVISSLSQIFLINPKIPELLSLPFEALSNDVIHVAVESKPNSTHSVAQ